MMFFAPDGDEGGGGGDEGDLSRGAAAFEPEGGGDGGGQQNEPTPPTPPPAVLDPKEFAKEFGNVLGEHFKTQEDRTKPPMSPEEAKKLLKVWEPDEEWYKKFDNLESRKDAVIAMRDGLLQQFDTLTQARLEQVLKSVEGRYNPALEMVQRITHEQRQARFDGTYPQLAKPQLQPLIEAVAGKMVEAGKKFNNEPEMFDAIAQEVEKVIKETNPNFKLEKSSGNGAGATKPAGSLPTVSRGAGGGTGKESGGNTPTKKRGLAVFD